MRLSFRSKLLLLVGATTVAFALVIVVSSIFSLREERSLELLEENLVPRLELGPLLEGDLAQLTRSMQDAAAAQDAELLERAAVPHARLLARLRAGGTALDPRLAGEAATAVDGYFQAAQAVVRRMIAGETGEAMVDAMAAMQARQSQAATALETATRLDRSQVGAAFEAARRAREAMGRARLLIGLGSLLFVLALTAWLSRGVIRSLTELRLGLARFGQGDFTRPVEVTSQDELGEVAQRANQMADSLRVLGEQRDRREWLTRGQAALATELQGELEPEEIAARAVRTLAGYLQAPAGALYRRADDGALELLASHALSASKGGEPPARFLAGEGLLGQASLGEQLVVIEQPPADYLRVQSALGEGAPRALVLLPLVHNGRVRGVLELALFKPASEHTREFLRSVGETLAIALEVSLARVGLRNLLAETQRQATRLLAQEEELRANNEELQAQQEELRQANEELDQQRRALERQNAALEDSRQRLEQKADELVNMSAYKSRFLANMSHELRTPLNSMLILSNLMAANETGNLTDKQVEYSRTIHSAGRDLLGLINQVLDLSKIESGKQELHLEPVPLWEIAEHLRRMFEPLAKDKGLQLSVELIPGLPERIVTDRQRLEQILTNLLGNAIKFTHSGQVGLRIDRPATELPLPAGLRPDDVVVLAVTDTGVGIAHEDQQRVFSPFEQVDTRTDRRYGGTGLGLTIARELAVLLGGELRLHSEPGRGSTFTCILPLEWAPAAEGPGRKRGPAAHGHREASNGTPPPASLADVEDDREQLATGEPYLLVIEDDRLFSEQLVDLGRERGWKVVVAGRGDEGLRLARQSPPKGIILDVRLPDMDGFAVMEQLRADARTQDIPVHFLSAVDAPERGWAMGAVGYLTKPVGRRELKEVVERLLPPGHDRPRRVLVVEDDVADGASLVELLGEDGLDPVHVTRGADALAALDREAFGCLILDLGLPDMDGLGLLETLQQRPGVETPPVLIHTGRALSRAEVARLEAYAEAVIVKDGRSAQRLMDELRLFMQHLRGRAAPAAAPGLTEQRLKGRKLLLADDDMRTVFAISALLRAKGAQVVMADNGQAALDQLAHNSDVDAVLMDVMMPEMDGYEAMRRIRAQPRWRELPIIALTAKAMKGERARCLEAGASDYLPKPVDSERLLATIARHLSPTAPEPAHDHPLGS